MATRIDERIREKWDAVVLDTGLAGVGKSTLALQYGRRLDPAHWSIPPDVPPARHRLPLLCYSAEALEIAFYVVRPGSVVVYDEAVEGLMAGEHNTMEQRGVVRTLMALRQRGAILFIAAPAIWLIAKTIRDWRWSYWFFVLRRGEALVHRLDQTVKYHRDDEIPSQRVLECPYLRWSRFPEDDPLYVAYQAEKERQMNEIVNRELLRSKDPPETLVDRLKSALPLMPEARRPYAKRVVAILTKRMDDEARRLERRGRPAA